MAATIKEVEAKKVQLETTRDTALTAAKTLTPATPEFDEAYSRYLGAKAALAKIPEELSAARVVENAGAIHAAAETVAEAIEKFLDGLKVAELLGQPVIALQYFRTESKDAGGKPTIARGVVFNPVAVARAKKTGEEKARGKRPVVVGPDGAATTPTKFVLAHLTGTQKTEGSPDYVKYPHILVDSQPKFEAFCKEHGLTGYKREVPA